MLKKARIITMIVLAASVTMTAALAVASLVLACLDLGRRRGGDEKTGRAGALPVFLRDLLWDNVLSF